MKPIGSKILSTKNLVLRPPREGDAAELVRIKSLPLPLSEAEKSVAVWVKEQKKPFVFQWIIMKGENVIGRIKAWDVNPYNGYLQLGYDVDPQQRGKGYMTEAVKAVIGYLMKEAQVNRVFFSVRAENIASRRVCEQVGMKLEGRLRQHYARQDGGFDDVLIYGIIKTEAEGLDEA